MENFRSLTDQVVEILRSEQSVRPSWDDYFMAVALLVSSRSSCERLHTGCVLVSTGEYRNRIIAAGYNGFVAGARHISKMRDGHEQATIHAEQNAITDAARRGVSICGTVAYISHFPCLQCSKLLVSSGIVEIKYHFDYNNDPLAIELLAEWRIDTTQL
jgi:dCMP deaminase